MKKLALVVLGGIFMASCGEGSGATENTVYKWNDFVTTYDKDYNMFDGNKELDGKEVTITGKIDKVTNYEKMDGSKFASVCFGDQGGTFGKCSINILFPDVDFDKLEGLKKEGKEISISGTVQKKKFGEISFANPKIK